MGKRIKPWLVAFASVALALGMTACDDGDSDSPNPEPREDMAVGAGGAGGGAGGAGGAGGVGGGVGGAGGAGGVGGAGGAGGAGGGAGGAGGAGGGAGGVGGGAGGAGGVMPCDEDLQLSDPCDAENDCCARGLLCIDFGLGGGPQCVNTCDANADPTGCDLRELCNPEMQPDNPDDPAPGACVPSQECAADAEPVCGEGSTCTRIQNITICTAAGDAGLGEACVALGEMPNPCMAGLVCEGGICRAACEGADMCGEDENCANFEPELDGQQGMNLCLGGCNIYTQEGCAEGETCAWSGSFSNVGEPEEAFRAYGTCVEAPRGEGVQNDECTPSEETYWGTCDHALCTALGEGDPETCLAFCDAVDRSDCINGSVCAEDALAVRLGLCLGNCDVPNWGPEGEGRTECGEGEKCDFAFIGKAQDGSPGVAGICRPPAAAELVGTGDECLQDMETGGNNCPGDHLCAVTVMNAPPTCIKVCEQGEGVVRGCPPGFACLDVFEDPNIGVCLEQQ